ncbi:cupin domain-containing protein [Glycomyces paridis]|uniref:Cupin n=1 Tax=Glycomyces paridis TaxID=2126555 RepID=A0A4S8P7F6_9ACTN|nr:cupin domain-containing protein [Glycomyces paridis]THV26190.1 cupin [Glycomyces paridis]
MRIVRSAETRRTETPAAVMTTLASPALGGAERPLWRVEAAAGTQGPVHHIDAEQVWTLTAGTARVEVAEDAAELGAGDTVVVPADVARRFTPGPEGFAAIVTGPAGMSARLPGGEPVAPPWTA